MKRFIQVGLMVCITVMVVTLSMLNKMHERMDVALEAFKIENVSPDKYSNSINYTKPVRMYSIYKGDKFIQYQIPGSPQGNFYAMEGATPSKLGISNMGYDPKMKTVVPKIKIVYVATKNFEALGSYAAPIIDDWSTPEIETQTQGSELQIFTTCKPCFEKEIENEE